MHIPVWPVLPDSTLANNAILEKFRSSSLAGLGDPCNSGDPDYDPLVCAELGAGAGVLPPPVTPISLPPVAVTTPSGPQVGYAAPPVSDTAAWANFAATLAKSGMTLAEINAIQPGTVVSANGAILRQSTGLPVPVTTSNTNLGLTASGSSGLLIAAAVGFVAVLMLTGRKN